MLLGAGRIVAYVDDINLRRAADRIPVVRNRASMVHELMKVYGLLELMKTVPSSPASEDYVKLFHSSDYINFLKAVTHTNDDDLSIEEEELEDTFGLGFDCPALPMLWSLVCHVAGGSMAAARLLTSGQASVAINWCGGWHHAQRDSASGFCYVNDVVLAIMQLRHKFAKVAYVDLDVHHGDGVENAFAFSRSVLTVSLHLKEDGFFPGTGTQDDVGEGEGRYFCLNVPYKAGLSDDNFVELLKSVVEEAVQVFAPDCLVVQCGGDALALDRLGGANISIDGYTRALSLLLRLQCPTMLLGGGGYEPANAARLWTSLTASVLGTSLDLEIPEHCFFERYGPSFDLAVTPSNRRDQNSSEYLAALKSSIKAHGEEIQKRIMNKTPCQEPRYSSSNKHPCYKRSDETGSSSRIDDEPKSVLAFGISQHSLGKVPDSAPGTSTQNKVSVTLNVDSSDLEETPFIMTDDCSMDKKGCTKKHTVVSGASRLKYSFKRQKLEEGKLSTMNAHNHEQNIEDIYDFTEGEF
ncbi:histone deacetylase 8-like [Hyalella azteca]|uniref:Histone deacetylase 8 n=1 Tax=Hyalella azteca TaxID=294128 RepID=A0A8B7PGP1_HYAAZ|nr:histone deacetylase 8-like [Hyalella azteca]